MNKLSRKQVKKNAKPELWELIVRLKDFEGMGYRDIARYLREHNIADISQERIGFIYRREMKKTGFKTKGGSK
jgi:hypothetical protein